MPFIAQGSGGLLGDLGGSDRGQQLPGQAGADDPLRHVHLLLGAHGRARPAPRARGARQRALLGAVPARPRGRRRPAPPRPLGRAARRIAPGRGLCLLQSRDPARRLRPGHLRRPPAHAQRGARARRGPRGHGRDGQARARPELAGHLHLHGALHRPPRHGLRYPDQLPRDRPSGLGLAGRRGPGHRRIARGHRGRPGRGHPGGRGLQLLHRQAQAARCRAAGPGRPPGRPARPRGPAQRAAPCRRSPPGERYDDGRRDGLRAQRPPVRQPGRDQRDAAGRRDARAADHLHADGALHRGRRRGEPAPHADHGQGERGGRGDHRGQGAAGLHRRDARFSLPS